MANNRLFSFAAKLNWIDYVTSRGDKNEFD
jgi:hypothetical protein